MTSTMHIAENYLKVYILLTAFWIVAHFYILFFLHITGMPIRQIEGISRRHAPPLHRLRLNNRLPSSNQIIFFVSFTGNFAKTGVKTLTFQNGAFPGSCGGPYIFRNKAVALHTESTSTTKTAEDIKAEASASGRKRKLQPAEITRMMVDSCVSSHTSLGCGIMLHVRSGIMGLLQNIS